MMQYTKYQTMQQGRRMSEDSMWRDYDTGLPSGKCTLREKVHMADLPSCERMIPKKKDNRKL